MWISCFLSFIKIDKRFSGNNNNNQTASATSSPVSEKRSSITASKKTTLTAKQHVNQSIVPVANKTSHVKGERFLSYLFFFNTTKTCILPCGIVNWFTPNLNGEMLLFCIWIWRLCFMFCNPLSISIIIWRFLQNKVLLAKH